MRERVTYVQPLNEGVDPKLLKVQNDGLLGPSIEAIREDRLTLTGDELPSDLAAALADLKELQIRWVSPTTHPLLEPFASRLSPGFHLSLTPREEKYDPSMVCAYLSSFDPLDCESRQAFTTTPSTAPDGPRHVFYQLLETPKGFQRFGVSKVCSKSDHICLARLMELSKAASVDVTFDASSGTLKVSALWPYGRKGIEVPLSTRRRVEAGILSHDVPTNLQPHELGLSGLLTVLGEQKEPSPALFSVSARHRAGTGSFASRFLAPTGLHPDLQIRFDSLQRPNGDETCQLYTYLTLPKSIFADQYQLGDDLFLASKNLTALRSTTVPVDLEAPAYTSEAWGSNILVQVDGREDIASAEIPLHLRYLEPSATGYRDIEVPYPVVFWACEAGPDVTLSDNPFDRTRLGYDSLFSNQTVFWHVSPQPQEASRLMNELKVPVLDEKAARWVGLGTGVVILAGFLWVLFVIARVSKNPSSAKQSTKKKQ